MRTYDPIETAGIAHQLIAGLAHQLTRANGYLDRLDAAIDRGEHVTDSALPLRHMRNDALTLRRLADALDERREALSGRAPRLRLLAAE